MDESLFQEFLKMAGLHFKAHPWHGLDSGPDAPEVVTAYIEIIPSDTVKYEVDKPSGHLKVDRPQKFSNIVPALYGFIPKTYCKEEIAAFCMEKTSRTGIIGDGDPLDICVLTERDITHGDIIVQARIVGGFRMIDNNEADDKIIAVLKQDELYAPWNDISELPPSIVNRLGHYFLTYKQFPGEGQKVEIPHVYGREEAYEVVKASQRDYEKYFGK
ncbi:MAG: inorganic pyrophosphatase [Saprospiraceae bacterium]|nr:inorganic pyrophosphatase [Saprospiraceae bacterium]